jgi:hypothetical protein
VSRGEDKPITVEPTGIGGIDLERMTEENGADVSRPERQTEVARLAGCDGVNGKTACIAGGELEDRYVHKIWSLQQTHRLIIASLLP